MTNSCVLDNRAREQYKNVISTICALCPEMSARKPERSYVQQAWMYDIIQRVHPAASEILCVGSFEDTAHEALKKIGFNSVGIDPVLNYSLEQYIALNPRKTYPVVYATSVIEHVPDDEKFVRDMCSVADPESFILLTCDFKPGWKVGQGTPTTSHRFYTPDSLRHMLEILSAEGFYPWGEVDWDTGSLDFEWEAYTYAFATLIVSRGHDD